MRTKCAWTSLASAVFIYYLSIAAVAQTPGVSTNSASGTAKPQNRISIAPASVGTSGSVAMSLSLPIEAQSGTLKAVLNGKDVLARRNHGHIAIAFLVV